jgi:acyl-CoA reductase-like NAD-dependent aldehyde dehydrogenase
MEEFYLTIDGKAVTTNKTFGVINPATEEVFAQAPDCSRKQLDLAVDAANRAFRSWRKDETARRQSLKECAIAIRSHSEELAELFTREQGRTFQDTKGEVEGSAWWIDEVANMEIPCNLLEDNESNRVEIRRKPLGVIGGIFQ